MPKRITKAQLVTVFLVGLLLIFSYLELALGEKSYSISTIAKLLLGQRVSGASFILLEVRLPKLISALLAGLAFGLGAHSFQTLLRNPLASPDIIGISTSTSTAAVIGLLVFHLSGFALNALALAAGLVVATLMYALAHIRGYSEGKLILIGIGMQAIMLALTNACILFAAEFDVPLALRWLSGSIAGPSLEQALSLLLILPFAAVVLGLQHDLRHILLGDELARALGVNLSLKRAAILLASLCMIALAASVTGPIACVMLLSAPIAKRLTGSASSSAVASALTAALLILGADLFCQHILHMSYPVGVITGLLGAPYLLYLIVRRA